MRTLLIANRGEIAIRIARTAAEMGISTVAVFSEDDATSLHVRKTDRAIPLQGSGPSAYLDVAGLVAAAKKADCDAVHPGYGFLSENAAFARACADARLIFVGPGPATLDLFGDKARARALTTGRSTLTRCWRRAESNGEESLPRRASSIQTSSSTNWLPSVSQSQRMAKDYS